VVKMKCKAYNGEVRSSEKDFETLQLGAFATPGLLLAQRARRLNCGIRAERYPRLTAEARRTRKREIRDQPLAAPEGLILEFNSVGPGCPVLSSALKIRRSDPQSLQ
jgi:hypothetical protein